MAAAAVGLAACGQAAQPAAPSKPAESKPAESKPAAPAAQPAATAAARPAESKPAQAAPAASAAKPETLQFPSWQQDEPGTSDWWKARIADFEKSHAGSKIEFTKVALTDHLNKLTVQLSAGSPPAIVHLPATNFFQYASQGWLEPLDEHLASTDVSKSWTPLQQSSCVYEGKTYGVLLLHYGYTWVYNEKLLQESGKAVPKTPRELVEVTKAMTREPDQFGIGLTTVPGFQMAQQMSTFVRGVGGAWTKDNKPAVTDPKVVEGLTYWREIVKANATPLGKETGPLRQLLMQGKVGSYLDGPWMQGFMAQANPDVKPHLKAAPVPFPNTMGGASNLIAVAKNASENQKLQALDFLKSLTTREAQIHYAETQGTAPPRQDVELPASLKEKYPYADVWIEASKKAINYLPVGLETKANEWQRLVSQAGQAMIAQNREPNDVAAELQKQLEELQKA